MTDQTSEAVQQLMADLQGGNKAALDQLLPFLYGELRSIARRHMRNERVGHTLESRALVHEAYLRLYDQAPKSIENRAHFIALASRLMRQVLVDYARERKAAKRDGGCRVTLADAELPPDQSAVDVVALSDALEALAQLDTRQAQVVELRFFGGLSIEETSSALSLSPATVKREWTSGRLWLHRELSRANA